MAAELAFALKLIDRMSAPALAASGQLRALDQQILKAQKDLRALSRPMGPQTEAGSLKGHIQDLRDQRRELTLLPPAANEGGMALGSLASSLNPYILALKVAGAATVAFVGGLAALTYSALKFAAGATEARDRSLSLFEALGDGSDGAGERTLGMLTDLEKRLPQTRAQLAGWTHDLERMGITDLSELKGQLVAVASVQAIGAEGGVEKYEALMRKIRTFSDLEKKIKLPTKGLGSILELGVTIPQVAAQMGISAKELGEGLTKGTVNAQLFGNALEQALVTKGAKPLERMGLWLDTVLTKGEARFRELFADVDFTPLSEGLRQIFMLFDEGTAHGDGMKAGITGALNGVIKVLGEATTKVRLFAFQIELIAFQHKGALDALWTGASLGGRLFLNVLTNITTALRVMAFIADGVGQSLGLIGKVGSGLNVVNRAAVGALTGGGAVAGETSGPSGGIARAPAHAAGGTVMQPAAGEVFASVAPGEKIVPAGGGGGGVHIDHLELNVSAPHGVTDAAAVSAHALATALEHYQLGVGR